MEYSNTGRLSGGQPTSCDAFITSRQKWTRFAQKVFSHPLLYSILYLLLLAFPTMGCIEGFDALNGADEAYYRLYDYRIDRPRVMGISFQPILPAGGEKVTFEALAASPDHLSDAKVEWWGCGLNLEEPFSYYGADCLQTSLAEFLGTGTSLEIQLPHYDTSNCPTDGCYGYIPVIAIIRGRGTQETTEEGYGLTYLSPDYQDEFGPIPIETDFYSAPIVFTMKGEKEAQAMPGESVGLEVRIESYGSEFQLSWYVSSGTLLRLGVTLIDEIEWGSGFDRNVLHSYNTLVVPDDENAETLHIYVVIDPIEPAVMGLERFTGGVLEVVR